MTDAANITQNFFFDELVEKPHPFAGMTIWAAIQAATDRDWQVRIYPPVFPIEDGYIRIANCPDIIWSERIEDVKKEGWAVEKFNPRKNADG